MNCFNANLVCSSDKNYAYHAIMMVLQIGYDCFPLKTEVSSLPEGILGHIRFLPSLHAPLNDVRLNS